MRKTVLLLGVAMTLAGCGSVNSDPTLCDFYQSLGATYEDRQGYVPMTTQDSIDEFC